MEGFVISGVNPNSIMRQEIMDAVRKGALKELENGEQLEVLELGDDRGNAIVISTMADSEKIVEIMDNMVKMVEFSEKPLPRETYHEQQKSMRYLGKGRGKNRR